MQYRIEAYKGKVNSVIDLSDDMIPVGSIILGEDLFIICLDPLEERTLPAEPDVEVEPKPEPEPVVEEKPSGD